MSVRRLAPLLGAISLGAAALAVPPARAGAQVSLIRNASFEENVLAVGQFRAPVTGWDAFLGSGSFGSYRPTSYSYLDGAPDGNNVLFLNPGVGIQQTLDAVLRPSATYDLSYLVGQRADVLGGAYTVQLLAGSTVLASDVGSLAPAPGTFVPGRLTFTAPALDDLLGQLLQIRVTSSGDGQPSFDAFSLITEPDPWIPIRNASFEVNVLGDGQFRAPVTGWDAYVGVESYGSYNPTALSYPDGAAPDGDNVLFLNPGAGIRQSLDAVLQPDATYTLSYLGGQRADVLGGPFEVALLAGESVLARETTTVLPAPGSFTPGQLTVSSRAFASLLGEPLEIRVRSVGDGQPNLDAFSLRVDPMTSAQIIAPEPRTVVLLAMGLAALVPLARGHGRHAGRRRDPSGGTQSCEIGRGVHVERRIRHWHGGDRARVAAQPATGARVAGEGEQLGEVLAAEDRRHAEGAIVLGGDHARGRAEGGEQAAQVGGVDQRLIGEGDERGVAARAAQRAQAGAERRREASRPLRVHHHGHVVEPVERGGDLRGMRAEDHDDRPGAGLHRGERGAAQQRLALVRGELLGMAEARARAGGEHHRADARRRGVLDQSCPARAESRGRAWMAAPSSRRCPPPRPFATAETSATTASAIASGPSPPTSRPTGPKSRSPAAAGASPRAASSTSMRSVRERGPSTPT
jgi:hypothetical protein